ncbi:hypothetical protein PRZ48_000080 [Zasmidium cellare]|uniref:chitinase n=1 Tax=Zasmidium cellare TaxID=395010 RepID=A0ABR0EYR8_ZASCE|nr:hypothetical protein PRZ48_000080 [Zasmidium cellare]
MHAVRVNTSGRVEDATFERRLDQDGILPQWDVKIPKMRTMRNFAIVAALAGLLAPTISASEFGGNQNIALYWGQNSYGNSTGDFAQQPLSTYCANADVDIIPMAFITAITNGEGGQPVINFANSGYNCGVFPGTKLWNCPTYTQEINTCQQVYGKKILISIGGHGYNESGFEDVQIAENAARLLWNMFGPVNSSSGTLRPFGNAVLDGFDIDIEEKTTNLRPFAFELKALMDADQSKPYYLTAAPQCPYPDVNLSPLLNDPQGSVPFDALFVQFYNNPACEVDTFTPGASTQSGFNFDTWNNWAETQSSNPNVKVFLGVPAGPTGGQGYESGEALKPVIDYCKKFSHFGGVSAWDASQAYSNAPWLNDQYSFDLQQIFDLKQQGLDIQQAFDLKQHRIDNCFD